MATNTTNLKDMVMGWIKEFTSKFYIHTHNGVDSLQLQPTSIQGGLVSKIVAGTDITISPTTGTGTVTINSSGGGGGSPGGNNTDVQYNNSGSFGGSDSATLNLTGDASGGPLLTVFDGTTALSGTVECSIVTGNAATPFLQLNDGGSPPAFINMGDSITIQAGFWNQNGTVTILGNNDGGRGAAGGQIFVGNGGTTPFTRYGDISLQAGNSDSSDAGMVQINGTDSGAILVVGATVSIARAGATNIVLISNISGGPPTTPTGGGCLYVTGGALTYKGSSGTVTTIAPA